MVDNEGLTTIAPLQLHTTYAYPVLSPGPGLRYHIENLSKSENIMSSTYFTLDLLHIARILKLQRCNNHFKRRKQSQSLLLLRRAQWAKRVIKRCGNRCDITGKTGRLHAHHLNAWAWFPNQRFALGNGVALSPREHDQFHVWMGGIGVRCTRADYHRYKSMRIRELLIFKR